MEATYARPAARWRGLAFDDDLVAGLGQLIELLGEGHRQADAAVAGRIARRHAAVDGNALVVDVLHPGHRRVVIFAAAVHRPLPIDGPKAERGRMAFLSGRDVGDADQLLALEDEADL